MPHRQSRPDRGQDSVRRTILGATLTLMIGVMPGVALAQSLLPDGVAPPAGQDGGGGFGGGDVGVGGTGGVFGPAFSDGEGASGEGLTSGGVGNSLGNVVSELQGDLAGTEALVGALTGSPEGLDSLTAFLNASDADPEVVAEKAERLMTALMAPGLVQDPVVLQEAIARIEGSASSAIVASPVMKTVVTPDFEIDERRIGFDFGPADGEVMRGFRRVDVTEDAFLGENGERQELQTVRRPNGDPLLVDGIVGVSEITLPAPNGNYRVVILSNDFGDASEFGSPFGEELEVNGVALRVANTKPEDWTDSIALTNARGTDVQAGDFEFVDPRQRGGAIVVDTIVSGGTLRIKFRAKPGQRTLLSGIVLEPSDLEDSIMQPRSESAQRVLRSSRQLLGDGEGNEERQRGEERIQAAAARVLTSIATAAGQQEEQVVASLLGPPDPVVDRGTQISAN